MFNNFNFNNFNFQNLRSFPPEFVAKQQPKKLGWLFWSAKSDNHQKIIMNPRPTPVLQARATSPSRSPVLIEADPSLPTKEEEKKRLESIVSETGRIARTLLEGSHHHEVNDSFFPPPQKKRRRPPSEPIGSSFWPSTLKQLLRSAKQLSSLDGTIAHSEDILGNMERMMSHLTEQYDPPTHQHSFALLYWKLMKLQHLTAAHMHYNSAWRSCLCSPRVMKGCQSQRKNTLTSLSSNFESVFNTCKYYVTRLLK